MRRFSRDISVHRKWNIEKGIWVVANAETGVSTSAITILIFYILFLNLNVFLFSGGTRHM